jgi:hypothetical protein
LPVCLVFALLDGYGRHFALRDGERSAMPRSRLSIDGQPLPLAAVYDRVAL